MEEELEITNTEINEELAKEELNIDDSVRLYIKELSRCEVLSEEEQKEMFKEYQKTKDKRIKDKLVEHNLRLAVYVAKKYHLFCQSMTILDLIQECSLTLIDTVDKYDIEKGYKFSTYAVKAMQRNLQREIDNQDSIIRRPVHVEEKHTKYKKYVAVYKEKYGRNPTDEEIKEALGITDEQLEIQRGLDTLKTDSLNRTIEIGDSEGDELESFVSYTEDGYSSYNSYIDTKIQLMAAKQLLSKKEYYIIYNRLVSDDGKTLDEIGKEFKITRERVRQIENKALKKLRILIKKYEQKVSDEYSIEEIDAKNVDPITPKNIAVYSFLKDKVDDITYYFFYNQIENKYSIMDFAKEFYFLSKKEIKDLYSFCMELNRNIDEKTKDNLLKELRKNHTLSEIFEMDIEPKQNIEEQNVRRITPKDIAVYNFVQEKTDDITYYFFYNRRENNYGIEDFEKQFSFLKESEVKDLYDFCDELDKIITEQEKIGLLKQLRKEYTPAEILEINVLPLKTSSEIKKSYQKSKKERQNML